MLSRQQVIWVVVSVALVLVAVVGGAIVFRANLDPVNSVKIKEIKPISQPKTDAAKASEPNSKQSTVRDPKLSITEPPEKQFPAHVWWLSMAVIFMSIATVIAVAVSFYLYHWRKVLLKTPSLAVPEQWSSWHKEISETVKNVGSIVGKGSDSTEASMDNLSRSLINNSKSTETSINELMETLMTLTGSLDEKDKEIRRLKSNYDGEVFRKFLKRFIRADQAIEDFQRDNITGKEALQEIRQLLEDALLQCDVEKFEPEKMSDYSSAFGVADNPKTVETDIEAENLKIAQVLECGYQINSPEGPQVITEAKVQIYQFINNEREQDG